MTSEEFRNNPIVIGNTLMNNDEFYVPKLQDDKNGIENFAQFHYNMLKGRLDTFDPQTVQSKKWKNWVTMLDFKVCEDCKNMHGKIYEINETVYNEPPLHPNCRCEICDMDAVNCGGATKDGLMGADYYLIKYGHLPDYYIDIDKLRELGWQNGKSHSKYAPGKMVSGGRYFNDNKHLPDAPGRLWFECDINYYEGRRNKHRILYSNDGLMFVTYDHYETFYEIIYETEN